MTSLRLAAVPLVVVSIAAIDLAAAELVVRDLQAGLSIRPRSYDYTLDAGSSSLSGSDGFDSATGMDVGGRYSWSRAGWPVGVLVGLDVGFNGLIGGDGTLGTILARPCAGVGWAINDRWEVGVLIGYSFGTATLDLDASNAAPSLKADGSYTAIDLATTVSWRLDRRFLLQGSLGYVVGDYDLDGDAGGTAATITMDIDGPYLGFAFIWRLSTDPVRLE